MTASVVTAGINSAAQSNQALQGSAWRDSYDYLDPWLGGLVLATYGLLFAVVGTRVSIRRDIT